MKKILKSKSGMTLIEMMAALLIFAIFATMVSAALPPILRQYIHTNELSELNTLLNNVTDDITESITNAVTVSVSPETSPDTLFCSTASGNVVAYTIDAQGILKCSLDGGSSYYELYDKNYYKNKKLELTKLEIKEKNIVRVELKIKDEDGSDLFERTIEARPIITPITR